jgi:hypothetical protein
MALPNWTISCAARAGVAHIADDSISRAMAKERPKLGVEGRKFLNTGTLLKWKYVRFPRPVPWENFYETFGFLSL